ncbi:hypothetical protein ANO14919_081290 [Xylariales sp. No.14919]|nr:hypothetical protein ANO14919_081290 [Xylariales sp. No.14919]
MAARRALASAAASALRATATAGVSNANALAASSSLSLRAPISGISSGRSWLRPRTAVRWSSTAPPAESKIWTFEEIQSLSSNPSPTSPTIIIDVREPAELRDTGRIPGALNIPISTAPDSFHIGDAEFEDRFGFARPGPASPVVFYCKAGVRSRAAAGLARDAGWTDVGEFPGSWSEWFAKGGAVER